MDSIAQSTPGSAQMSEYVNCSYARAYCSAREAIRSALPDSSNLTDAECRRIIQRYCAGVGANFVTWLAAAVVCCRSIEGRYAATENAFIEIRDDHPAMLTRFAAHSGASPELDDYRFAEQAAFPVKSEISKMSGLYAITLVGTLENVSLDYIPWLGEISRRLGNTDMEYIDIHGEADILHANQFCWALEKEAALYDDPDVTIAAGADDAVAFIRALVGSDRSP